MEKRTMVKLSAGGNGVSVRTVSRGFRSPGSIFIEREKLRELQEKGRCIVREGLNAADMARHVLPSGEECVRISFIWLQGTGDGSIGGYTEQTCLPYLKFLACAVGMRDGDRQSMLSVPAQIRPKIEFQCGKRLKEVAANRTVRRKFGRFLDRNLSRLRYKRVVLSDDCEPYSFGFACYTADGLGLCGGIILHRQGRLKDASYGMHT